MKPIFTYENVLNEDWKLHLLLGHIQRAFYVNGVMDTIFLHFPRDFGLYTLFY